MKGVLLTQVAIAAQRRKKRKPSLARRYAALMRRAPSNASVTVTQSHYRRPADTIIEQPNGNLLWCNGIDKMLRFTPYAGLLETAGIVPPGNAISLTGSGTGNIVGQFYAYCRFVDRDGNFSSLSPISNVYEPSITTATVSGVTNASPMVVTTSSAHGLINGQTVKIKGVYGCDAANGIWVVASATATTFALTNIDQTNSIGNGTYVNGGTVSTGVSQISYQNVPTTTEAKVSRRQILRNKDGEAQVFYIDIDTTDLTSATLTSNTTSQSLTNPVAILDSTGNTLTDKTVPPNYKKFIVSQNGRVFAAGIEPYCEGAVSLTTGSASVTGIGTEWGRLTFPGRLFTVSGGNKVYTIESVNSTTSLTLTTPYTGSTDPYAYYSIYPSNPLAASNVLVNPNTERRTVYWSEPGQPEAWPPVNQVTLAEDPGAGELTGLMALGPYVYIFAQNRTYQFSFVNNPATDGYSSTASQRGCINNRCWIKTEDVAFAMDFKGFHIFSGNNDAPIGSMEVQDLFRPRQVGPYKINWDAAQSFHAVFDPGEATIRWFVCLGGNYAPRHAICYQLRLRRWWIEEYPWPVGSSCLGRLNGKPQVFLGSDAGRIFALSNSSLDGLSPSSGTVRGTVTSAGVTWIADTSASFPSSNVVNNCVRIVSGTGKGQMAIVVSVSGTTLNVDRPWIIRPDTTSVYQIGGIKWKWKSGWMRWSPDSNLSKRAVHIMYGSTADSAGMNLVLYADRSKTPVTWASTYSLTDGNGIACLPHDPATDLAIDTTKANGYVMQRMDNFREEYTDAPRFLAVEVNGVTNSEYATIQGLRIDGVR